MEQAKSETLGKGLDYARQKNYAAAVEQFTSVLCVTPPPSAAFYYRACAYSHLGKYSEAIVDFTSAISSMDLSRSHETLAFYKRGYARMKTRQYDEALDDYRIYTNLCHVENSIGAAHQGHFQIGILFAATHRHETAIQHFTDAIENSRRTKEDKQKLYYLYRGRAYACNAQFEEAMLDLSQVVDESEDLFIQGCAYNELGQHEEALQKFSALLESNETQSSLIPISEKHAYFRRGLCHASLDSHTDAVQDFQKGLEYSDGELSNSIADRLWFRKAMSLQALNDPRQAMGALNNSILLNKQQPDVYLARGLLQQTMGQHNSTTHDLFKALQLHGDLPSSSGHQGINRLDSGYFEKKVDEIQKLLQRQTGNNVLCEAEFHRIMATYYQRQASYSHEPLQTHKLARSEIAKASQSSKPMNSSDLIMLAVHQFCECRILNAQYPNGRVPTKVIDEYIASATGSILNMNELFQRYLLEQDWSSLRKILRQERDRYVPPTAEIYSLVRYDYLTLYFNRAEMIEEKAALFNESPAQKEFYTYLVIRLCNLFDAIRVASTDVVSHALKSNLKYVATAYKLIGTALDLAPIEVPGLSVVFSCLESTVNDVDSTRIQNTLRRIGNMTTPTEFDRTATDISKTLTNMYEDQIKRFPTRQEETSNNNTQEPPPAGCFCSTCCARCFSSCRKAKETIFNDGNLNTLETIATFAAAQIANRLTSLETKEIGSLELVSHAFITAVCRPSFAPMDRLKARMDKIKPMDAKENTDQWNADEFFRRPAIAFNKEEIWAREKTDKARFGSRQASNEENDAFKNDKTRLDTWGFKNHEKKNL